MVSLLSKVSSVVAACTRRVMRRRLSARRLCWAGSLCLGRQFVPAGGGGTGAGDREEDGQGALWRRAILMGQRCKPLDFPGAIHYDSLGRRVPVPRCGSGSGKAAAALFCRSSDAVDEAVTAAKKARYA